MHRRNSSSEFCRNTLSAIMRVELGMLKQPVGKTLRTSTNVVSGFWNNVSITTSGSLPFTISVSIMLYFES